MTPGSFWVWRDRLGLTREEAAQALGTTRMTIWRWERGRCPMPHWLGMLCAAVEKRVKPAK